MIILNDKNVADKTCWDLSGKSDRYDDDVQTLLNYRVPTCVSRVNGTSYVKVARVSSSPNKFVPHSEPTN